MPASSGGLKMVWPDGYASMRKACEVIQLSIAVYLYRSVARDITSLVMRMREITRTRLHYGYRIEYVMVRREGFKDNHRNHVTAMFS
jgi:putative transposase